MSLGWALAQQHLAPKYNLLGQGQPSVQNIYETLLQLFLAKLCTVRALINITG